MRFPLKATFTAIALALAPLGAFAQTAVPAGQVGNFIVNPWMEIDQLNEGGSTSISASAAGTFTYQKNFDAWQNTMATSASGITGAFQNAAIAPNGSASDALYTVGTGSATHADGTLLTIEQRIEPPRIAPLQYGTANAQISYLSFCAKASIAGTYGFYITGGTAARTSDVAGGTFGSSYFHAFSIPTAAQFSCYQFPIPGDTGGTWLATTNTTDATHGATLGFVLGINGVTTTKYGVPTTAAADGVWFNTTATNPNVIGNNSTYVAMDKTTGSTFELTGVRWSLDGAPLGHDTAGELALAQRYVAKTFQAGIGGTAGIKPAQNLGVATAKGYASAAGGATGVATGVYWPFPVQMRAGPTITTFAPRAASSNCSDMTTAANSSAATVEPNITSNLTTTSGVYVGCAAITLSATGVQVGVGIQADARL